MHLPEVKLFSCGVHVAGSNAYSCSKRYSECAKIVQEEPISEKGCSYIFVICGEDQGWCSAEYLTGWNNMELCATLWKDAGDKLKNLLLSLSSNVVFTLHETLTWEWCYPFFSSKAMVWPGEGICRESSMGVRQREWHWRCDCSSLICDRAQFIPRIMRYSIRCPWLIPRYPCSLQYHHLALFFIS